jgi:hypothetical protein
MIDQLTGGMDKMFLGASHVKYGGDKENDDAENKKIEGNPPGNRRFPETAIQFKVLCGLHINCPLKG